MTQQALNFQQKIIDLLVDKWTLTKNLKADQIHFAAYELQSGKKFQHGKQILIECVESVGVANPQSLKHTQMLPQFKIDLYMRISAPDAKAREKGESDRALIKDKIWQVIHNNQTAISTLEITTFSNWLKSDELDSNPIVLHNSLFLRGEWFHKGS